MNISTKVWLSISVLLLGYLITVTVNALLGHYAEQRLSQIATTLFPATTLSREVELGFNAQVQAYEGAVLTGDRELMPAAAKHAAVVGGAVARLLSMPDLPSDHRIEFEALQQTHKQFTAAASVTYQTLSMGQTGSALQVEAARLNAEAGQLNTRFKFQTEVLTNDLNEELAETVERSIRQRQVSLVVLIAAAGISLTLVYLVISSWTGRLAELIQASGRLARGDFTVVLSRSGKDEIGRLASSFVSMQEAISARNEELRRFNESLEEKIRARTYELSERNEELVHEIEERKRAQAEVQDLHNQLLDASRRAGMVEVATGVLHNVGNVLNSVNVSTNLIRDHVLDTPVSGLAKAADLMLAQGDNLGHFMQDDDKGRQLPTYLKMLADHLATQQQMASGEVTRLSANIDHIKQIVQFQQSYGKSVGVIQMLKPQDVMEEALRMNAAGLHRHAIYVERHFSDLPAMPIDRHKVLQILVNLIANAKQAIKEIKSSLRRLIVHVQRTEQGEIQFIVTDTGVGIPPENLKRIFGHGFTTKPDGHGFGLHSSANAAKEMNGTLAVSSGGLGQGATFTLTLPIAVVPSAN